MHFTAHYLKKPSEYNLKALFIYLLLPPPPPPPNEPPDDEEER